MHPMVVVHVQQIEEPRAGQTQAHKAEQWATTLKGAGTDIVTIAVGNFGTHGMQFIDTISSLPSSKYVFNPSTWDELPSLLQSIIASICPPSPPSP